MNLADYSRLDATGLAECIRRKDISAAEAQQCARQAATALNPRINAMAELFDAPLSHDTQGPLGGVPFLIKDLVLQAEGALGGGVEAEFRGPGAPQRGQAGAAKAHHQRAVYGLSLIHI